MDDQHAYTPESIDRTLRQWPRYQSLAEGVGSSVPDAHRHGKGTRYDPLQHADRCADIEMAIVMTLKLWSIEWCAVDYVRRGHSLTQIAAALHVRTADLREAYDAGCDRMARYLGWVPEPNQDSPDPGFLTSDI